ncbi:hypothetical protein ACLI1A_04070 [Flavobacterium sp. RHBU_3]|uniref:hypothetical protein n=1 Tax=Flavobacterium sp. RHBU_3 TaxID=3391184 RepID=UPI00398513EC
MKYLKIITFSLLALLVFSCKDDDQLRIAETQRTEKTNDSILKVLSRNWHFDVPPPAPKVAQRISGWNEWEQFNNELQQKPTGTLEAFKRKAKVMVTKASVLRDNIPPFFNKPQVRARLDVVVTNIQMMYTYMNLETIPDKKIISLIGNVTRELTATQNQFDEIIRFSEIPKEEGEEQMLRALDTTRLANPDDIPMEEGRPLPQAQPLTPKVNPYAPAGHGAGYNRKRLGKRNNP